MIRLTKQQSLSQKKKKAQFFLYVEIFIWEGVKCQHYRERERERDESPTSFFKVESETLWQLEEYI